MRRVEVSGVRDPSSKREMLSASAAVISASREGSLMKRACSRRPDSSPNSSPRLVTATAGTTATACKLLSNATQDAV